MKFLTNIREWFRQWYLDTDRMQRHATEEDARRLGGVVLWGTETKQIMMMDDEYVIAIDGITLRSVGSTMIVEIHIGDRTIEIIRDSSTLIAHTTMARGIIARIFMSYR